MADAKLLAPLSEDERVQALHAKAEGHVKTVKAAILAQKKAVIQAQAQVAPAKPLITRASWEEWLPN